MDHPASPRTAEPSPFQASPLLCTPREIYIRDCTTPPIDDSTDGMSDKEAKKPMFFRCLLLLLPVAIPVVVYLRDIDAMRRIFLTAFILLLIIVLSCMMVNLLRKKRRNLEGQSSNGEIARELAQRHFLAVTHRFLPRTPIPLTHGRCHRECDFGEDVRRSHGYSFRPTYGRYPTHYHLAATTASRSPSPHGPIQNPGPLPLLSLHFPRFEFRPQDMMSTRCDDPPTYEDAILCPPETPHRICYTRETSPPETPPPTYEAAVG